MGVEHVATDSSFPFSQTDSTLCYAFDIMNLSDQILEIDKVECSANSSLSVVSRNSLKPGMIVSVNVTTPLLSGNLDGELSIYVKGGVLSCTAQNTPYRTIRWTASLEQPPRDDEHRDAPPRVAPKLPIGALLMDSPPQERA